MDRSEPATKEVARSMLPAEARMAMVGDILDSDILGDKGEGAILVSAGNTQEGDVAASPAQPDYVLRSLAALMA